MSTLVKRSLCATRSWSVTAVAVTMGLVCVSSHPAQAEPGQAWTASVTDVLDLVQCIIGERSCAGLQPGADQVDITTDNQVSYDDGYSAGVASVDTRVDESEPLCAASCLGRGMCDTDTGLCDCVAGYEGDACELNPTDCPATDTRQYACSNPATDCGLNCVNGTCGADATCECATGWASDESGACTQCAAGFYGPACEACPGTEVAKSCKMGVDSQLCDDEPDNPQYFDFSVVEGDCSAAWSPAVTELSPCAADSDCATVWSEGERGWTHVSCEGQVVTCRADISAATAAAYDQGVAAGREALCNEFGAKWTGSDCQVPSGD